MRKAKKKLDIKRRNNFSGFEKLIFLSMLDHFKKNFVYFPFRRSSFLCEYLIRNRCGYSGRSRSVHRRYRLSRSTLKYFIHLGFVSGVSRKSW